MGWKRILNWIIHPINSWKERQKIKKRLAELQARDPFIYK